MEIHNTTEDLVIAEVNSICDSLIAGNDKKDICTCEQCRTDTACYVLNRADPHYVVSHRGVARVNQEVDHQCRAELTSLIYEGLRRVSHNQRPYIDHENSEKSLPSDNPAFNFPTIMGQVFNGLNFSPMTGITVELLQNGKLAQMKDNNWQNPYTLIPNTGGVFTFWPKPAVSKEIDVPKVFEFTVRIEAKDFLSLNHVFSIPVVSKLGGPKLSLTKTHKLPDLYLFPPGEEENQLVIND